MKLFEELMRRNVFRVAGVYAVVGWLLIQVGDTVFPTFDAPPWVLKVFVALVIGGFPIAIVLAWAFELTPEGVKLTKDVAGGASTASKTGRRLDYAILVGFVIVALIVVASRLTPSFDTPPSAAPEVQSAASAASIAVLPFADLSPTGDQAYFADGIAEEILNALANVGGLDVASRTSSFAFRSRETTGIPAIAAELKVRHVLEGSVRKAGASLRITAQLIDAENDRHLWSQTYDRPLTAENVFAIQDEIAGAIVAALDDVLGTPGAATPAVEVAKSTTDLSAYDLYLKARALYQRRESIDEAELLLGQAVEQDPNFTDAWALRAATLSLYSEYVETDLSYEDNEKLVDDYAARALALDPDNARAIAARANFRLVAMWNLRMRHDLGAVLADLRRAVALDPRDSSAVNWLAMGYALAGESGQALETFAACAKFDPFFGPCMENYYDLLVVHGRYDDAWAQYQEVLSKGIVVSGWTNFSLLAHFDQKAAFMQATNHPSWLPGWRRHADLYEAFKHPDEDHSDLVADLEEFVRTHPQRGVSPTGLLLIPIGGFDALPTAVNLWAPDHAAYRRSPQFKAFIRDAGVYDYWREHGFPAQCRPFADDDFQCN
jgi:TolB-like protein/Tfp pilus assembly protein PilF